MKSGNRIYLKLLAVIVLSILFIILVYKDKTDFQIKQPAGEGIMAQDVWILLDAIKESGVSYEEDATFSDMKHKYEEGTEAEEYLVYKDYLHILSMVLPPDITESERNELLYQNKYKDQLYVLKSDWYHFYKKLLIQYGLNNKIVEKSIGIVADNSLMTGIEKTGDGYILDQTGKIYKAVSNELQGKFFRMVKVYMQDDKLLTLLEEEKESLVLSNVWLMEADEEALLFYFSGFELRFEWTQPLQYITITKQGMEEKPDLISEVREQVGDLSFAGGELKDLKVKADRINGKILAIGEGKLELENQGSFEIADNMKVYKLYEELAETGIGSLALGYDFTDFAVENGKICAALIMRKEKMESIRVAVKGNGFGSLYHEELRFDADEDMELIYGSYGDRKTELVKAGEELVIKKDSKYMQGDRLELKPLTQSGKIQVASLGRSQGAPSFRGRLEVAGSKNGLILINELLLEEYLYSVVPSEMPASYPGEALKAQAVCARTFAYRYLKQPGLPEIGANVDDSVSYQVYNNITEHVNATKAVKETTGTMLFYNNEPVNTYYYSTSCGFGTDAGVWNDGKEKEMPYLVSGHIGESDQKIEPEDMKEEENFKSYIMGSDKNDFESGESWYRWQYQVPKLDTAIFEKRLKERYSAGPDKVLTYTGKAQDDLKDGINPEDFKSEKIGAFRKILDIRCLKRRPGGVMDQLLVVTDQDIYLVSSEYNIRYILNNGGEVTRQDGTKTESKTLLPSAYFVLEAVNMDKSVVGYSIFGGGYGHGVGMSQNGAKVMGEKNMSCEEILAYFYKDCNLEKIY